MIDWILEELRSELKANGTIDMDVVDDLMDKVRTKCEDKYPHTYSYEQICKQLREGKKLKVRLMYGHPSVPTIKVTSQDGTTDSFDLDCVRNREVEDYEVEKPINQLTTVSVVSYKRGGVTPIQYIYVDPHMKRLFAHLENGKDVPYDLNILDLNRVVGEYKNSPVKVRAVFFINPDESNEYQKFYAEKWLEIPEGVEVSDWVKQNVLIYPEANMVLFPEDSCGGFPSYIPSNARKTE